MKIENLNEIKNEVKKIVRDVTRISIDNIDDFRSFRKDFGIESLQILQVISLIKDKFEIEINDVEIYNIDNILDVIELIMECKK